MNVQTISAKAADLRSVQIENLMVYPETATLAEFVQADSRAMLLSLACCLKSPSCPHRQSSDCDISCRGCAMGEIQQACAERLIKFRIETTNDALIAYLDQHHAQLDWIIGVACPFEVEKLAPLLWERYHLRQIILPLQSRSCPSHHSHQPGPDEFFAHGIDKEESPFKPLLEILHSIHPFTREICS